MSFCTKRPLSCGIVVGIRPEAIKLASVVMALRREPDKFAVRIVTSGQHGHICRSALDAFGLAADIALDAEPTNYSLAGSAGDVMRVFGRISPKWLRTSCCAG